MKNKNLFYLFLILFLAGGYFYWTQIRIPNIRKGCYNNAFRPNEFNGEWAEGKIWHPGNNEKDKITVFNSEGKVNFGWFYDYFPSGDIETAMTKHKENRNIVYEKCLIKNNISK